MIGIIGAMDEEVAKLKEQMENSKISRIAAMDFYEGKLSGKEAVVVRSGIGKVNAAVCAQILIDRFGVGALINTGIAGSLRNEINIGDIVLSEDLVQHDMDAVAFGYKAGQVPRMDVFGFAADPQLIRLAKESCERVYPEIGVHVGRILSGDQFIADHQVKERILSQFGGYCCEMEGAAIAQTAYLNQLPFVILRAISDKADDSAHMDYPAFEAQAIERSVKLVADMVSRYQEKDGAM